MTFAFKTKPYDHQLQIFNRSAALEYFALFMEQGTGKSKITIDTASKAFQDMRISAVVIFAKKGVYGNWYYEELPKHSSIPYRPYLWKGFLKTREREEFASVCSRGTLAYFICNVDALTSPKFKKVLSKFIEVHPSFMLVGDETTSIKSPKADRTKAALKLAPRSAMRRILSGLPNPQSPLDLYTQCTFLKPGILGHNSYFSFKNEYAIIQIRHFGNRAFKEITGYRDVDGLSRRIKNFASIIKKEDCLDLPPKMYKTVTVELSERQRGYYDDLLTKAVAYVEEHEITAINALSMITRLLQICCGQLKVGDDEYVSIENNRIQTLLDLIEESPGKIIVWTHYVRTARDIMGRLGTSGVLLSGGLSAEDRQTRLQLFKKGEPRILVANPASSGHGITLTEAETVIYYSNSYNLEHRLQSEDRTHRIGQTKSVLYMDLVAPNTIEPKVIQALKNKKTLADQVINSKGFKEFLSG